jgi:hypothetical protein
MKMEELQGSLGRFFGDNEIPHESTLRRWAMKSEGIIDAPRRYSKGAGGGKGQHSDWSDEALEDAAACWYIRQVKRPIRRPSITALKVAKKLARRAYKTPLANPYWFTGKPGGFSLHPLTVRWICTIEKIRHKRTLDPIRVAFNWSTERASKEGINQLDLEIVLEEPSDLTKELNDAARKYYEAVRDAVYVYDKFLSCQTKIRSFLE